MDLNQNGEVSFDELMNFPSSLGRFFSGSSESECPEHWKKAYQDWHFSNQFGVEGVRLLSCWVHK
jgi:hypothetical protein